MYKKIDKGLELSSKQLKNICMLKISKVILLLLLLSACDVTLFPFGDNGNPLELNLDITAEDIQTLQDIEADFAVINTSIDEVTYGFSSSCQHGFIVQTDSDTLFNSRYAVGCLAVSTSLKLQAGESKEYPISLASFDGSDTLANGTYTLKAFLRHEDSPEATANFTVE